MDKYRITATSTFGIESLVEQELKALGYKDLTTFNGRVSFEGEARDIAKCNLHLRTADRVLVNLAEFPAYDFDQLFEGVKSIDWGSIIPLNGKIHVVGKSVRSKLHGVPTCQAMTKKAIVELLKKKYNTDWLNEDGPEYKVEVALYNDAATISLDSSGRGLNQRGYRAFAGEAPLRENLAAAMVGLSRWEPPRILADPLCGSGTIAIEAALIGRNIAPGLRRSFSSEGWKQIPQRIWKEERRRAGEAINKEEFRILASDIDGRILKTARENAKKAGIEENIAFQTLDIKDFKSRKKYGCIVTNPPYGERVGEEKEVEELYKTMGKTFSGLDSWSYFILSANERFERSFGKPSSKNRKLYNGNLRCYLYQYFGPLPAEHKPPPLTGGVWGG